MKIQESNKLIAEFMGYSIDSSSKFFGETHCYKLIGDKKYDELTIENVRSFTDGFILKASLYHSSWDWLMPVVEKITQIEDGTFSVDISSVGMWACYIKRDDVYEKNITDFGGFEPVITNVYKAVVEFIKWYNQQKK